MSLIARIHAIRVAPADDEAVSLTREGKLHLRERYNELKKTQGYSLEKVGEIVGCSHGTVRMLIHDEETIGLAMDPIWSSPFVPGLCRALGVRLWDVIAGIDEQQARALELLERVRESAPDKVDTFLATMETLADGTVGAAKQKKSEEAATPRPSPPPLRPVD